LKWDGYRQKNINVTRLYLPRKLAEHFRIIHQMEKALREVVRKHPQGKFEGIYLEAPMQATRKNVLDPNSIGIYVGGGYCNPRYPLRTAENFSNTKWLDDKLQSYKDDTDYYNVSIDFIIGLLEKCLHDLNEGAELWNIKTLTTALEKLKTIARNGKYYDDAYIRVRRNRNLEQPREETQGFLTGGEAKLVPNDKLALFIYRINENNGKIAAWWPLIRFPDGNYILAFSF